MIKPYIYGGIALLIVGLFSYSSFISAKLETANILLESNRKTIANLEKANEDLIAVGHRKAGAANAYMAMTEHINQLTKSAGNVIKNYKARGTENEKCLDLTPPSDLIDRLRAKDNLQGRIYPRRSFRIFTLPLYFEERTYYV